MPHIQFQGISRRFGQVQAVQDLTFNIPTGSHHLLVGPSGSGKSTTLRLLAGLESPDTGRILFDDHDVTHVPPESRGCGWVAQSPGLLPHLTLIEQLELPLRLQGMGRLERRARAKVMADRLGLARRVDHLPSALSGGEAARAALGRALMLHPRVLLLDEPFAHLDPTLRRELRRFLGDLQREFDLTILHVTHHPGDFLPVADQLTGIHAGRLQQSGRPIEIHRYPRTPWLADLTGDAPVWCCPAEDCRKHGVFLPPESGPAGNHRVLGLRPEQLSLCRDRPTHAGMGPVCIRRVHAVGARTWVEVHWGEGQSLEIPMSPVEGGVWEGSEGNSAWITWEAGHALWFEVGG